MTSLADREKDNRTRLVQLLNDKGTQAMRNVFDSIHPPDTLTAKFNSSIHLFQHHHCVHQKYMHILFPPSGIPSQSKDFDIFLLSFLLRHISGLHPPASTGSWDANPPATDTSREANLARIMYYRGKLFDNITTTRIDDATFHSYWNDISAAVVGLGVSVGSELPHDPLPENPHLNPIKGWEQKKRTGNNHDGDESECMERHAPLRCTKITRPPAPWLKGPTIEDLQKQRNVLQAKAQKETELISPPNITLEEFNPTTVAWSNIEKEIDVLVMTVNDHEHNAATRMLSNAKLSDTGGSLGPIYCGDIGENFVALVRSKAGAIGDGAAISTVHNAIHELNPKVIVLVGVCFGMNKAKQKLGDLVVSTQVAFYGPGRVNKHGSFYNRATLYECRSRLVKTFQNGKDDWKRPGNGNVQVKFGLVISGPELIDNLERKQELLHSFPEALGREMEAEGVYDLCNEKNIPWIVCKSICDWADGTKNKEWHPYAAYVAASYAKHVMGMTKLPAELDAVKEHPDRQTETESNEFYAEPGPNVELENEIQEIGKHGKKKNNRIPMYLIGQCGVGKTSLKRSLLGEEINKQEPSTVGIEFDVVEVKDSDKSKAWSRSADKQFMVSEEDLGYIIAKETVRRKVYREKKPYNGVERETVSTMSQKKAAYEQGDGNELDGHQVEEAVQRRKESREVESTDKDSGQNKTESNEGVIEKNPRKYYWDKTEMKRKIIEAMKNIRDYDDDAMDRVRFFFGDVGGQSVYYDVHSILLRQRSLFLLVVDLEKPLNDKAQLMFVDSEMKEVTLGNPLEETNLDYAKKWIAALRDLCPLDKKNEETSTQSTHQPKVIVVFTKPDKLDKGEVKQRKQDAYKVLIQSFKGIRCESLIVANYTIKNTSPKNEEDIQELKSLRNKIFETAQEILRDQEKTPIKWLVFERILAAWMKAEDRRYIALDHAQELAEQCNVKETFCEAMKFFHEENIVVHFHEKEPLRDLVVLDAAWLVELLTQVITVRPHRNCGGEAEAAWNELMEKGELNFARLPNALKELKQQEAWKEMMVRAGLISHWKDEIYFAPSMVTTVEKKEEINNVLKMCSQPSLYIDFKGDCIPLGFFTRLQVEFIKWMQGDQKSGSKTPDLHCNFSCFPKQENGDLYFVYLIRSISRIQVAIRDDGSSEEELGVFAKSVLTFLRDAINNVSQNCPSFKSTRVNLGLKCDLCCKETKKCDRHQKEACTDNDCVCIPDLPTLQKGNIVCEKNKRGNMKSDLTKSFWVQAAELIENEQPDGGSVTSNDKKNGSSKCKKKLVRFGDINPDKYRKIYQAYNTLKPLGGDYKTLAGELGYVKRDVDLFEQQSEPAKHILDDWDSKPGSSVFQFLNIVRANEEIYRNDVLDILKSELQAVTCNCGDCPIIQSI